MVERIYYQGYHVGSREDDYNKVPATVQSSFINLINDPIYRDEHEDLQKQIDRLDADLTTSDEECARLRVEIDELEEKIEEVREVLR